MSYKAVDISFMCVDEMLHVFRHWSVGEPANAGNTAGETSRYSSRQDVGRERFVQNGFRGIYS